MTEHQFAKYLVDKHRLADPQMRGARYFPSPEKVRLLEVTTSKPPNLTRYQREYELGFDVELLILSPDGWEKVKTDQQLLPVDWELATSVRL